MLLFQHRFSLTQAVILPFLQLGFLPWTPPQPSDISQHSSNGNRWKPWVLSQSMPTTAADIKHLCEEFLMLAGAATRWVFQWCYKLSLLPLGSQACHCRPDLSLHCFGFLQIDSHVTKCYFHYWERMKGGTFALQSIHLSVQSKLWVDRHTINCPKCLKICIKFIFIYSISQFSAVYPFMN